MGELKFIEVEWAGKTVRVPTLKYQGRLWFHWRGRNHVVDQDRARRADGGRGKTHPGVICAPMPGKVTRVLAARDQSVVKGQPLVVMEAMKMEYTLAAARDGKVSEVNVSAGTQVGLGEVLVKLADQK